MALRVLLADESSTIKKVIQLALQDFSVDVKTVHLGIDVLEVARQYKPQIIFADVLLQKKNGYEVCYEIKADPATRQIPVILMWSSFMEVDHNRIAEVRSDGQLEKPFDVDDLRALVMRLVPELRESPVASYLSFGPSTTATFQDEEKQRLREFKKNSQRPASPAHQAAAQLASFPPHQTPSHTAQQSAHQATNQAPNQTSQQTPQPTRAPDSLLSRLPFSPKAEASQNSTFSPEPTPSSTFSAPPEAAKDLRSWSMDDFQDLGNFADNAEVSLSMDHPAITSNTTAHKSSMALDLSLSSPPPEDFDFNDFKFSNDDLAADHDEPPRSPLKSPNLPDQNPFNSSENHNSFYRPNETSPRSNLEDFRIDLNDDSEEDFILADISQDRPISRPSSRAEVSPEVSPEVTPEVHSKMHSGIRSEMRSDRRAESRPFTQPLAEAYPQPNVSQTAPPEVPLGTQTERRAETRPFTQPLAEAFSQPFTPQTFPLEGQPKSSPSFQHNIENFQSSDESLFKSFEPLPSLSEFKDLVYPQAPAPLETQDDLSILISRHVEKALREHLPKIIEESVRKLLPGVATSIITREIEKVAEELSKRS